MIQVVKCKNKKIFAISSGYTCVVVPFFCCTIIGIWLRYILEPKPTQKADSGCGQKSTLMGSEKVRVGCASGNKSL